MGTHRNISRRRLLSTLPFLPAGLRAQFTADVKVVNLFATVRDKKDQIVKGLTKDDFLLDEEGRAQTIRYFSAESNLPLTVGLLIDTSGSTRLVLPDEVAASRQFLAQVLRPKDDRAFVIHFSSEVELLQDLTGSREALERSLGELAAPQQFQRQRGGYPPGGRFPNPGPIPGGRGPGGRGQRRGAGGTALYDAVFLGADEIMRKQSGRKALILLSDGEDNGSRVTFEGAIEAAQRSDTIVYTILFSDSDFDMRPIRAAARRSGFELPDGKKVMRELAESTGARFFEVSRKLSFQKVFAIIEEDLRNQYSLGYSPDPPGAAGTYRRIKLKGKQKGLVVQTRDGYYAA
jgi:VWFA-related protein